MEQGIANVDVAGARLCAEHQAQQVRMVNVV
ncbi:MAG: hypothetical protein JWM68_2993 [Verrucomicrobiales bacterium]|nr:hypothetical protein [Verrucomicrobiales bacterium]